MDCNRPLEKFLMCNAGGCWHSWAAPGCSLPFHCTGSLKEVPFASYLLILVCLRSSHLSSPRATSNLAILSKWAGRAFLLHSNLKSTQLRHLCNFKMLSDTPGYLLLSVHFLMWVQHLPALNTDMHLDRPHRGYHPEFLQRALHPTVVVFH